MLIIVISFVLYFYLFVFGIFRQDYFILSILLIILIVLYFLKFGYKTTKSTLIMLFVFIVWLLLFGFIFQMIELYNKTDWLLDSYIKALVFPNTVLFINILVSLITFTDIILLPISFRSKIYLIWAKSIFYRGDRNIGRLEWHLDTYPYLIKDITYRRFNLYKYSSLIISLYFFLVQESKKCWLIIENRKLHIEGIMK